MAMTTKIVINNIDAKRRTLRSNLKHSLHNNNPVSSSKQDNIINQIQKQIEHQQANNATKSSFPINEDIKSLQQQSPLLEQIIKQSENAQQIINQYEPYQINIFDSRPLQSSNKLQENSLEERINPFKEHQKKQTILSTPPSKSHSKIQKRTQSTPYKQERKSYRKVKKDYIRLVPFRKCQDQFQNRIVSLINKICQNKKIYKEIQYLRQKVQKISSKDMFNPYVISGIQTIQKLLSKYLRENVKNQFIQKSSFIRFQNEVQSLNEKILMELGKTHTYETVFQQERCIDMEVTKPKFMRKIYRILIQRSKYEAKQARLKSCEISQIFFTNCKKQPNQYEIMCFIREQAFFKF